MALQAIPPIWMTPGMSVLTVNVALERAFCVATLLPGSLRRGAKLARDPVECLGSAKCRPLGERSMRR